MKNYQIKLEDLCHGIDGGVSPFYTNYHLCRGIFNQLDDNIDDDIRENPDDGCCWVSVSIQDILEIAFEETCQKLSI